MNEKTNNKPLTKKEIFICEITWGCVPIDIQFVRNSKLFHSELNNFEKYKDLYNQENNGTNKKL